MLYRQRNGMFPFSSLFSRIKNLLSPTLIFIGLLISTLILYTLFLYVDPSAEGSINIFNRWTWQQLRPSPLRKSTRRISTTVLVLLWTPFFSRNGEWVPQPTDLRCSVSRCIFTSDRSRLSESDAIVLHLRDVNLEDLPSSKGGSNGYRWVLLNQEAPPHTPRTTLEILQGNIHYTVTYRRNSDIYAPYGKVVRRKKPLQNYKPGFKRNRHLICWTVSNCATSSQRETYVQKLRHYVPVTIYGKCGQFSCPDENVRHCYKYLSEKCKFYLSFENSICKDYVTEKLFEALRTDMVPIVLGDANYEKLLPNNSYINALDFNHPRDLANYLLELDKNDEKYYTYLAWKEDFEVIDTSYKWVCDLCEQLKHPKNTTHWDLVEWWYEESNCRPWINII